MGEGAPYLYEARQRGGPTSEFNPRAYTQASYAASIAASQKSRPVSTGPLINFNKHPDSYMVVQYKHNDEKPLPSNTKTKIVVTRWVQFGLKLMQLVGALGLLFCGIVIKGAPEADEWIMKVAVCYTSQPVYTSH